MDFWKEWILRGGRRLSYVGVVKGEKSLPQPSFLVRKESFSFPPERIWEKYVDMLRKSLRLKTKKDFERVFRNGKPLFFGSIACKIVPNALGHIRLGFSLGKKHIGTAVARNRMKRVISEPFSRNHRLSGLSPSYDIAFFSVKRVEKDHCGDFASVAESVVRYICK